MPPLITVMPIITVRSDNENQRRRLGVVVTLAEE